MTYFGRLGKTAGLLLAATLLLTSTAQATVFDNLRITEINYHPTDPTATEIGAGATADDDFEFIEFYNTSTIETLNLSGVYFANGVDFVFPAISLLPERYVLVVRHPVAFQARYGASHTVAGFFANTTGLNNGGETLELRAPGGQVIHLFTYGDTFPWPIEADGNGSTLEVLNTEGAYSSATNWAPSLNAGGTPSAPRLSVPDSLEKQFLRFVEINYNPLPPTPTEIAANFTEASDFEFIELLNLSPTETLELSGVRFTAGVDVNLTTATNTSLLPGHRAVIARKTEAVVMRYGAGVPVIGRFGGSLNNGGEQLRLEDANSTIIQITEYDNEGAWPPEPDGQGATLEVINHWGDMNDPLNWRSSWGFGGGSPGGAPYLAESPESRYLRITEVHYNPATDTLHGYADSDNFEFIELQNTSAQHTLNLTGVRFTNGLRIDLTTATTTLLGPGQVMLLVSNQTAFELRYSALLPLPIFADYAESMGLNNAGEDLRLVDANNMIIHLFEYNDRGLWPRPPDGEGPSLEVIDTEGNYSDGTNWRASAFAGGTPGVAAPSMFRLATRDWTLYD